MTDESTAKALHDEGVSEDAMKRLAQLQPGKGGIFTSDLTVNEFLLVREVGFRPLGLVLGSSIYHVGIQLGRWSKPRLAEIAEPGERSLVSGIGRLGDVERKYRRVAIETKKDAGCVPTRERIHNFWPQQAKLGGRVRLC